VNSIIGMVLAAVLLGLTWLGSPVAFTALSSIGIIIGLEVSYIIPIALRLTTARNWFKKVSWKLSVQVQVQQGLEDVWGPLAGGCMLSSSPTTHHMRVPACLPACLPAWLPAGSLPPGQPVLPHRLDRRRVGLLHQREWQRRRPRSQVPQANRSTLPAPGCTHACPAHCFPPNVPLLPAGGADPAHLLPNHLHEPQLRHHPAGRRHHHGVHCVGGVCPQVVQGSRQVVAAACLSGFQYCPSIFCVAVHCI
jgi:hypothetical protein